MIPSSLLDSKTKYFINPTGRFVVGGPQGDCGLTGRKIIVDTYGGVGSHGGGAFSGKDPTKVDRSASYMARHIAKNIVAAGLADRLELQIAYAIGVADPVSVMADTDGHRARSRRARSSDAVREIFPLTPKGIIEYLNLRRPIYKKTAAYGHFGRNEAGVHLGAHRQGRGPARSLTKKLGRAGRSRDGGSAGGAGRVSAWRRSLGRLRRARRAAGGPSRRLGPATRTTALPRAIGVVHVHTTLSDGGGTPEEVVVGRARRRPRLRRRSPTTTTSTRSPSRATATACWCWWGPRSRPRPATWSALGHAGSRLFASRATRRMRSTTCATLARSAFAAHPLSPAPTSA